MINYTANFQSEHKERGRWRRRGRGRKNRPRQFL